jgi:hypothetical protein
MEIGGSEMDKKKISKEEANQIIDLVVKVILRQLMSTSTPTDWAKAGTGYPDDTLQVTLNFPKKFVEGILSHPGAVASLNLFVTTAISHYVTYKAESVIEDLEEQVEELLAKESPNKTVTDLTKEYMNRVVIN